MRNFLKYWLPVLLWMALIFGGSADTRSYQHSSLIIVPLLRWLFPHMPQSQIDLIHHIFRKCCHLSEYAILALFVFRALNAGKGLPPALWTPIGGTLLIVFLYASSDEFHQSFVPTRTARFSDVCIDTAGGSIGLFAAWLYRCCRKPREQK